MRFTIDDKLWAINDPRIDKVHTGELSLAGFVRASLPQDPWQASFRRKQGDEPELVVTVYDEKGLKDLAVRREAAMRQAISRSGGITGRMIWEKKDAFLGAYPELQPAMAAVADVITKSKCKGCALNQRTKPLLDALLGIPAKADRDYTSLANIIQGQALERLKTGKEIDPASIHLETSKTQKKALPARQAPLVGEHQLVWLLTGEADPLNGRPAPAPGAPQRPTIAEGLYGSPRPACLNCSRKHLATAIAQLTESMQGYPAHRWLAVGEMNEASAEILGKSRKLADEIRAERLAVMENSAYMPNLLDLIERITELDEAEKLGIST